MLKALPKLILLLMTLGLIIGGCGGDKPVDSGNDYSITGLLQAEKAIPADAVIDSAIVYLYSVSETAQDITMHLITDNWDESSVTSASFGNAFNSDTVAEISFSDTGWHMIDITTTAQGWFDSSITNFGFFLRYLANDTAMTTLTSRESDQLKSFVEIFYTVHEGADSEIMGIEADSYIFSAEDTTNYGAEETLLIGGLPDADSTYNTLIKFMFDIDVRYVSIGDFVFFDANANGIQDDSEPGLADVEVNLYDCDDTLIATVLTNLNGNYSFDSLLAGEYKLEFGMVDNYLISPLNIGDDDALDSDVDPETMMTECFTILPGIENSDIDAGYYPAPGSIGDFVWNDSNMNGLQDDGEDGINGIAIMLYDCDGNLLDSAISDSNGAYLFDMIPAGEYYLKFVNPFGYIFTLNDIGDDDDVDSDVDRYQKMTACITIEPGDELFGWDAGLFAYEGCTFGKGYWKNHAGFGPQDDMLSILLPVWLGHDDGDKSIEITDAQTAVDILTQHIYGHPSNGITKLYAHLLTAKLNIVNFSNPEDAYDTIDEIDDFLSEHDWNDWDDLDKDQQKQVNQWKGHIEEYNEGLTGPGHCNDDNDDDDF